MELYLEIIRKKAQLLGLHLKTGDTLTIGILVDKHFFVIRSGDTVYLHPMDNRTMPEEVIPLLIKHNVHMSINLSNLLHCMTDIQTN